jgi:hypothetical protein
MAGLASLAVPAAATDAFRRELYPASGLREILLVGGLLDVVEADVPPLYVVGRVPLLLRHVHRELPPLRVVLQGHNAVLEYERVILKSSAKTPIQVRREVLDQLLRELERERCGKR